MNAVNAIRTVLASGTPTLDCTADASSLHAAIGALAGAHVLLVYEWLINFDSEYKYIHKAPWSAVKLLFLSCRYWPLIGYSYCLSVYMGGHSTGSTATQSKVVLLVASSFFLSPQVVMFLRAYAFSGRRWPLLVLLAICSLLTLASGVYLLVVILPLEMKNPAAQQSQFTGCTPNRPKKRMSVSGPGWIMIVRIAVDVMAIAVVVIHCWRSSGRWVQRFIKGGFLFFVGEVGVSVVMLVLFSSRSYLSLLGVPYAAILANIIACRVLLHLRSCFPLRSQTITRAVELQTSASLSKWGEWAVEGGYDDEDEDMELEHRVFMSATSESGGEDYDDASGWRRRADSIYPEEPSQ